MVGSSGQNESRVKTMYRWKRRTRNSLLLNIKFETFLHKVGLIFFNIRGWASIRGSIFWEICLKIGIFGVQTGGWASIRAWTSKIIFMVTRIILKTLNIFLGCEM